jgi:hypothetical protein
VYIYDLPVASMQYLTQFFTVMHAAAGKRIFVHCAASNPLRALGGA